MMLPDGGVKRVALVRLDRIGDFLLWVSTAKHYRGHFSNAEIVLIVNEAIADIASALPYWDHVVPIRLSTANRPVPVPGHQSLGTFDAIINLQASRIFHQDAFIGGIAAQSRLAANMPGPNITAEELQVSNRLYTHLIDLDTAQMHEVVRNFEMLRAVTGYSGPARLEPIAPFLQPAPVELPARFVAILPGSSWRKKSYPWPRFVQLCKFIHQKYNLVSVIVGWNDDAVVCRNICRNAPRESLDLYGRLTLWEGFDVIKRAAMVVSNDSMGAHAANLLEQRSVCILNGGYNSPTKDEGRFFPYPPDILASPWLQTVLQYRMPCYGCSQHCKYDELVRDCIPCVDYIPIESLIQAVDQMLSMPFVPDTLQSNAADSGDLLLQARQG